jgi:vanillate O-demethylase ferredoxin subunit
MIKPVRTVTTVVRAAEAAGEGIRRLTLMDPDGWELPPFAAGGHVDVHLPGGYVRSYSLCNDPIDGTRYVIAVKREPHGRGGSLVLHDRVRVGEVLGVSLPRRGLTLVDGAKRHVFVAGGIGITPFLSLAATLRRAGAEFILHLCARGEPPLRGSVEALATIGRAVVHDTRAGRPDLAALIGPPDPETQLYCCGPTDMIAAFEEAAMRAGWRPDQTHVERFVPLPTEHDGPRYAIVLARSGISGEVPAGGSALAALRALGVEVDASCEGGICGACRVRWLEGPPIHRDRVLSPAEREREVMVCVSGCAGPRLVVDL